MNFPFVLTVCCPIIFLYVFIFVITFDKVYKLRISSVRNFARAPVTHSVLGKLSTTFCSQTHQSTDILCSWNCTSSAQITISDKYLMWKDKLSWDKSRRKDNIRNIGRSVALCFVLSVTNVLCAQQKFTWIDESVMFYMTEFVQRSWWRPDGGLHMWQTEETANSNWHL